MRETQSITIICTYSDNHDNPDIIQKICCWLHCVNEFESARNLLFSILDTPAPCALLISEQVILSFFAIFISNFWIGKTTIQIYDVLSGHAHKIAVPVFTVQEFLEAFINKT
jgi:hypothetical protein